MTEKEIIKLLKSGNFTIAYHDNCAPFLYQGRCTYEELDSAEEIEYEDFDDGYCPAIVALLVKALNGNSCSI